MNIRNTYCDNKYDSARNTYCDNKYDGARGICYDLSNNDYELNELIDSYKNIEKDKRGNLISKYKSGKPYVKNPFTNEDVPVYCKEESDLLEQLYNIEDEIRELESWLGDCPSKDEECTRAEILRLENLCSDIEKKIDEGRNGEWKAINEKQKKLAEEKEKNRKAKEKKKKAERAKEEKRQAERRAKIDNMPDDLKEVMDDLFS